MRGGDAAFDAALDRLVQRGRGGRFKALHVFGGLYQAIRRRAPPYPHDPGMDPFRKVLRARILREWSVDPGTTLWGKVVAAWHLHSLRTAAKAVGMSPAALRPVLVAEGLIAADDRKPPAQLVFDAAAVAPILEALPRLVDAKTMAKAMGITASQVNALTDAGLLTPRVNGAVPDRLWRPAAGPALVARLLRGAEPVSADDRHWMPLADVHDDRLGATAAVIARGELRAGRRRGCEGLASVGVPTHAAPPKPGQRRCCPKNGQGRLTRDPERRLMRSRAFL